MICSLFSVSLGTKVFFFSFALMFSLSYLYTSLSVSTEGLTLYLPAAGPSESSTSVFISTKHYALCHAYQACCEIKVTACCARLRRRCTSLCVLLVFVRLFCFAADQREAEWERADEMSLQALLPLYLEDQTQRVNKTSQEPSATVKVTDCRAPTCVCQSEGNRVGRREAREEMRRIYATKPITQLVYVPSYLFLKLIFTLVALWKRNRPLSLQRK